MDGNAPAGESGPAPDHGGRDPHTEQMEAGAPAALPLLCYFSEQHQLGQLFVRNPSLFHPFKSIRSF